MNPHVSAITLAAEDFATARAFYAEGLGWPVTTEHGEWVSFAVNGGALSLGLLPRPALSADAGAEIGRTGGFMLSYVVRSEDRVAEVLAEAEKAGGTIVKPAEQAPWGGTHGWFADPDGHLWKVAAGSGDQPYAE